ncbi:MAG: glycosyltransferase family 4 protein [Planctomycetota bacterium]|nr:glycosyltransferase family 4 protein [Planctomycetota bacterium]
MRVLRILTRANLGGPARQVVALHEAFRQLGHEHLSVVGSLGDGETELPLPDHGFVRVRGLVTRIDPAGDLIAANALRRIVRDFRPDVIHTHTAKAGMLGAAVARRVPLAHTYHGHVLKDYFGRAKSAAFRIIERRLCRRRDLVTCVSESCGRELVELGVIAPGAWRHVPPALRLAQAPALRHEVAAGLRIAWCGRLVPIKDPSLLVGVTEELARLVARVEVHVFGSGPLSSVLEDRSDLPFVLRGPCPDLPELLAGFDAMLFTSKREGLPLAAVEALHAGVPIVGPRVRGLLDLEGPGVRLVARDAGALARSCLDPPRVPGRRRELLRTTHDPCRIARALLEEYGLLRSTDARHQV